MRVVLIAVGLVVFLLGDLHASDSLEVVHGNLGKKLDEVVREYPGVTFSGSVLCAKGGAIYLAKGYGLADRGRGIPNTTITLFDVGSVAKQHTAASILWLSDRGLLSVTDPLSKHVGGVPKDKEKITLHQMLTHTSGLTRGLPQAKIRNELHTDREAFLKVVLGEPLESKPGEKFAYNNMAYMVLAAVVERVSKEEFGPFLKRRLFHPLLLTNTGYCGDTSLDASRAAGRYLDASTKMAQGSAIEYSFSWLNRGATSIVTDVWDMYGWSRAVLDDLTLSRESMKLWLDPVKDDYACGWMRKPGVKGLSKISHGGDTRGFHTMYSIYPDEDVVVVLLANTPIPKEKYDISLKLEELLLSTSTSVEDSALPIEGRYKVGGGDTYSVVRNGGSIALLAHGQSATDRLVHGAAFVRGETPDLDGYGTAAEKLLKPLVRGRRKDFLKGFAEGEPTQSAEALLARWKTCSDALGRARTVTLVGTVDLGNRPVTWVESDHSKGKAYWRVEWRDKAPVAAAFAGRDHPIGVRIGTDGESHAGWSIAGHKPIRISFKKRGGKVFAMVWEKVDGFDTKRAEFRRARD